jgi:hypothetical protein
VNASSTPDDANLYQGLVKQLRTVDDATVPAELAYGDLRAIAITRDDLRDDVDGINASIELIKRTRGGRWPAGPVSDESNFVDLVWHECEFRDGGSYTFVLRDAETQYLGCLYLYPVGRRTPLSKETIPFDVDVSWWVTPDAYARGYYKTVHHALRHWIGHQLPFASPLYSNAELPTLGE